MWTLNTRSGTHFFAEILSVFGEKNGANNLLQKLWKEKDNRKKLSSEHKEVEYLYVYLFLNIVQVKAGSAHMNCILPHKTEWKL